LEEELTVDWDWVRGSNVLDIDNESDENWRNQMATDVFIRKLVSDKIIDLPVCFPLHLLYF
jgi:hypothetical protein